MENPKAMLTVITAEEDGAGAPLSRRHTYTRKQLHLTTDEDEGLDR